MLPAIVRNPQEGHETLVVLDEVGTAHDDEPLSGLHGILLKQSGGRRIGRFIVVRAVENTIVALDLVEADRGGAAIVVIGEIIDTETRKGCRIRSEPRILANGVEDNENVILLQ